MSDILNPNCVPKNNLLQLLMYFEVPQLPKSQISHPKSLHAIVVVPPTFHFSYIQDLPCVVSVVCTNVSNR